MTVGELLRRTGSRELSEWMEYEKQTGLLGQPRDDQLAALIAATVANSQKGKGEPIPVTEFVPDWDSGVFDDGDDS